jgi:hypothetical protein
MITEMAVKSKLVSGVRYDHMNHAAININMFYNLMFIAAIGVIVEHIFS